MRGRFLIALTAILLLAAVERPIPVQTEAWVSRVIDGDTVVIRGGERVRYLGVDAPESGDCFGSEATAANRILVEGKKARLIEDRQDRDRYGRLLRRVFVGKIDVSRELARRGYARRLIIAPNTADATAVRAAEAAARRDKAGLWSACPPRP
ncbi:MAG: thermonuclease family protein [Patescibacteria group bacterium]